MSISQDIRTRRKHRGKTPWQLVQTIGRLEREADDRTCQMVALATENDELRADRNRLAAQFEEAVIANQATIDDLTEERDGLRDELAALKVRFGAQLAADANANRITVPPMQRDTSDPADQATQPIPVMQLQKAAAAGLLGPVLDPGHP